MSTRGLPEFDLDGFLPYRLTVLAAHLSAEMAQQYKKKFGISNSEWRVLVNVGYAENPSVRDIEKRVSLEKSKVSRAAARLEVRGLITKVVDPDDRRLVNLTLTEKGTDLLSQLVPIAMSFQSSLEAKLGEAEEALIAALDLLSEE
ncbi:MarR family winged helix-turn-helix transcriptional regulator [Ruegeria sp. Ofav3-42]|uniref:MarR family winged helix-turn-helix transcriptional regulator n=1 Tax=Ruegeria sp. Ofav3-42 TaxID=2917759 RepID=UPI001EF44425|nr:MarR family transcriptional regulator [Ruegeria sp. Ofav3-42]MCG7522590.1 MarR family transcriptional regulator [Ruegeria sp. Ofav3-42]